MKISLADLVVSRMTLKLPISIEEGLGLPECSKAETHTNPASRARRPQTDQGSKTRRQKAAEVDKQLNRKNGDSGHENCHDEAGLLYGRDKAMAMADFSHVDKGCWATDTINANCWSRTATYIRSTAADFVVAQETRIPGRPNQGPGRKCHGNREVEDDHQPLHNNHGTGQIVRRSSLMQVTHRHGWQGRHRHGSS